jgi:branched-chain amino acid transport system substrate-binding protein
MLRDKYGVGAGRRHRFVGTANAYDGMHLVAMAIDRPDPPTGPVRRPSRISGEYKGLIKTYKHPFTAEQHDAPD